MSSHRVYSSANNRCSNRLRTGENSPLSIVGAIRAVASVLGILRGTCRQLGWGAYHVHTAEALAVVLGRGDGREGGAVCIYEAATRAILTRGLGAKASELRHRGNDHNSSGDRYGSHR